VNNWIKACDENTLRDGELLDFDYQDKKILIAKMGGKIFAADRICTHAYADLSIGIVNEYEKTVTCPLHLSAFKLEDGKPQNLPAEEPLFIYETKIENGNVYINI
jgi:nitrite reductase/ring-hydroxylating ferredoxin subunit